MEIWYSYNQKSVYDHKTRSSQTPIQTQYIYCIGTNSSEVKVPSTNTKMGKLQFARVIQASVNANYNLVSIYLKTTGNII